MTYGGTYYKSCCRGKKNKFSYIVMQVIWCLKFCNMKNLGDDPPAPNSGGGTCPPVLPVIYAHARCRGAEFLRATTNRSLTFLRKKCTFLCPHPQCKILVTRLRDFHSQYRPRNVCSYFLRLLMSKFTHRSYDGNHRV